MKKHTKLYFDHFGFDPELPIMDELFGIRAVDIHHIDAKGMGGNPNGDKDVIENLMAATRRVHEMYGDKKDLKPFLKEAHLSFMEDEIPFIRKQPHREEFNIMFDYKEYREIILWYRQQN